MDESPIKDLRKWKREGKTTALFFGRFQPLHKGHLATINSILQSGLDLHIFINAKSNTADERNPYSIHQKIQMFKLALPHYPQDHLHAVDVYLGGGGDIGNDIRKLTDEFTKIAPADKCVIFYGDKQEDIKTYLVDGEKFGPVHYVDFLTKPIGSFDKQAITSAMTSIFQDATKYRKDRRHNGHMLPTPVANYVAAQHIFAQNNNRNVGDDPAQDERNVDVTQSTDSAIATSDLQLEALRDWRTLIIRPTSRER